MSDLPKSVKAQAERSETAARQQMQKTGQTPGGNGSAEEDTAAELAKARQQLKVLRGKYDAEVKADVGAITRERDEARAHAARLEEQFEGLRAEIQSLRQDTADKKAREAHEEMLARISALKEDGHPEHFIKLLTDMWTQVQSPTPSPPNPATPPPTPVADLRDRFFTHCRQRVSDFDAINHDQAFIAWLQGENENGIPRDTYLQQEVAKGFKTGDATTVIAFIDQFKSERNAATIERETQTPIDPDTTGNPDPGNPDHQGKKTYTLSEVRKWYKDKALGRFKDTHTPEQLVAIDADIVAAQGEGRILPG